MDPSSKGAPTRVYRILYADDVRELRLLVEQILSSEGHWVKCVEDGLAAWHELQKTGMPYDILITDHNMPRMNGLELVQALRLTNFDGRIIVVSSDLNEAVDLAYHELKVDQVFKKPFPFSKLRNLVADPTRNILKG